MWPFSIDRQSGFSLLEVLVAFVILALSLGVIMRLFSVSLNQISGAERRIHAVALAESVLASLGQETPLTEGEQSGEDGHGYRWSARINRYVDTGAVFENLSAPELYQIELDVVQESTSSGSGDPVLSLTTLRLAPKP